MSAGAKLLRAANAARGTRESEFFKREATAELDRAMEARLGRREFGDTGVGLAVLGLANAHAAKLKARGF